MCAIMFVVFTYACTYAQMHTAEFCVYEKSNVNDTVVMCALKLSCIDGVPRSRLSIYHACMCMFRKIGPTTSTRQESQSSMVITFSDQNLTGQSAACFAMIDYNISLSLITLNVNNAG